MQGRGLILRIDLSTEKITREPISEEMARKYIGGEGINTRLLWEHFLKVDPKIDPLNPDNVIIWGMGPLGATAYGAGSKSRWTFKGPAYNMFGDTTCGGAFGPQMRWAGYDHLVITGKAKHPVYISVTDEVEIRDAGHLWGKTASASDDAIKGELGDGEVETVVIGPGGENLVRYASLTASRYRSAARTGAGCVFGSKNLKAVAAHGTKGISVHDRAAFYKAIPAIMEAIYRKETDGGSWARERRMKYGSLQNTLPSNKNGWNGYRNGQWGQSPAADRLSGEWYNEHMQQRFLTCSPGCAASCQAWHAVKGTETPLAGRYIGQHGQRPDYGMITCFGTNCDIADMAAIANLTELCNDYSLDIFEVGMSIAFLMELWQRGIITKEDMLVWTGEALSLDWGNVDAVEKIIDFIAYQKNQLGRILNGGVYQAAKQIEALKGVPVLQYANYGKGGSTHEQPMKSRPQLAMAAALAAIGTHHLNGAGIDERASITHFGRPDAGKPLTSTLKGAGQAVSEYYSCMHNSLGTCKFGGSAHRNVSDFPPQVYAPALYAITGMEITGEELFTAGKRIANIKKAFNSRLGLTRKDDTLGHRWLNDTVTEGPARGLKVADYLEREKDAYYEYHGWDKRTSLQKRETLEKLGLADVAAVLEKEGVLA